MFRQKPAQILATRLQTRASTQAMQAQFLFRMTPQTQTFCTQIAAQNQMRGLSLTQMPVRNFATKRDDDKDAEPAPIKKRRGRPPKNAVVDPETVEAKTEAPKKVRASRAKKSTVDVDGAAVEEPIKKTPVKRTRKTKAAANKPINMYVLKFNSPILPYAKFPLTHNRYIQEFIKMYEEDKEKVDRIIGVHFP